MVRSPALVGTGAIPYHRDAMTNTTTLQLVVGLLLMVFAFGAGVFWWVTINLHATMRRAAVLKAALGTISGICYMVERDRVLRLDGRTDDDKWPRDLSTLMVRLPEPTRQFITTRLRGLAGSGTGFSERIAMPATRRILEFSGHRLTASGEPSLEFVWVGDVTEREDAATRQRRTEQLARVLQVAVDRLPLPVWWRGTDPGDVRGNKEFDKLAALDKEALDKATRPVAAAAIQAAGPATATETLALPDGLHRFDIAEMPVTGGGTVGFAIDQTATDQLKVEMERLALGHQQVLEAVTTAIAIWAADTRLVFCNSAFVRLWGLDRDWLATEPRLNEVLETLRELRALPEYADFRQFRNSQAELFTTLEAPKEEVLHLPDERTLRLWIRRHPFGGLIYTYEDVTDSLALERSYNTLAEVQRETLDNLAEGIAVFGSDARLKLWNPTFGRMWQLGEADLASRPHVSTLVDKARPFFAGDNWDDERAAAITRITAYAARTERIERRGGSVLQMTTVPLPDGNVLLTYLDITDTARVQKALRDKADALEEANRLKSEFISNVSYELRTPLNAIIGFAEILTNQYFGPLNERQLDYSRGVLESSQRLMSLINDILDLATIEAGQLVLEREPLDIHALLASILALTRERAQRLELAINFDCPTDIGMVIADEQRLRQAVFNLVSNAVKFTPSHGTVTLSAKRVGNEVALIVADTGIGIEPDRLGKVFEKFERGDPTAHPVGAGLGLSLVKSFIELHGGRVEIASAPLRGTRVTCWLPSGSSRTVAARVTRKRAADAERPAAE